jgi:hypothetical protein
MSEYSKLLTRRQLEAKFNEALKNAIELGTYPGTQYQLNILTKDAINQVASEYPYARSDSIQNAQNEFSEDMDILARG